MRLELVQSRGTELRVQTTQSAFERMRGLLGSAPLKAGDVMVIEPCNMVHTIGMAYAIDVMFIDRSGRVLQVHAAVPPWRFRACWQARYTVELTSGEAARRGWTRGTRLSFLFSETNAP